MKLNKKMLLYVFWVVCIFLGIYGLVKSTYSILSNELMVFDYTLDVDTDKKIIKSVESGTTVAGLLSKILIDDSKYSLHLYDSSRLSYHKVVTGDRVILKNKSGTIVDTYYVSVMGDVTGDGEVTIDDVQKLFKYYRGEVNITSECYLKAGDVKFGDSNNYVYLDAININDSEIRRINNLEYKSFSTNDINITLADVAKLYQYVSGGIEELDYYSDKEYVLSEQATWSSSDTNIVTVDSSGNLNGVGVGSAIVTATTSTGKVYTHHIVVESSVIEPDDIYLDKTTVTLKYNETAQLNATVYPYDATDKTVSWESNNEDIVTVDDTGKITAVGVGSAIITATTVNGISVTCNVTVENADRIHFVSNGNSFEEVFIADKTSVSEFKDEDGNLKGGTTPSEVILLESQGKFALIDTGLSNTGDKANGNPNRVNYTINYLKSVGVKELEFIIITHVHFDHMGGAYKIAPEFNTKKIYSKFYEGNDLSTGTTKDNNLARFEVIENMEIDGVKVWEKINGDSEGKKITFGNMEITFLSTTNFLFDDYTECHGEDENVNSIMTYITVNGKKIFFTGDVEKPTNENCAKRSKYYVKNNCTGKSITECVLKGNSEIRNVDLFKLPHHGYSSCDVTTGVVNMLNPKNIVIFNWEKKVEYFYNGIELSNGTKVGPRLEKYTACADAYFSTYKANNKVKYVDNTNLIYDFTDGNMNIYTIE